MRLLMLGFARVLGGAAVLLVAAACDVTVEQVHEGETISADTTWSGTHLIKGGLTVNAALTIEACTTIKLDVGAGISVADGGELIARGRQDCPITFTSAKTVKAAGDWSEIDIYGTSSNANELTWVVLEHGGTNYGVVWLDSGARLKVEHSRFDHLARYGLYCAEGAELAGFAGNTFSNLGDAPIYIGANSVKDLAPITTSGNSKNYVLVTNETVTTSGTWQHLGLPYRTIGFGINALLDVAAGTTIEIEPDGGFSVADGGALRLNGTSASHVVLRSAKATPAAGDWNEIDFYASSDGSNRLTYAQIMHGGGANYGQIWVDEGASVSLENSVFSEAPCDVYLDGAAAVTNSGSTYDVCP